MNDLVLERHFIEAFCTEPRHEEHVLTNTHDDSNQLCYGPVLVIVENILIASIYHVKALNLSTYGTSSAPE